MRRRLVGFAFLAIACACNTLTGAADLSIRECASEECSASDGGVTGEGAVDGSSDGGPPGDGGADARTDGPTTDAPSYCAGLSFYVRFDGNTTASSGDTPADTVAPSYGPGKFGNGYAFAPAGVVPYDAVLDAAPMTKRWDPTRGTVALWFRGSWAFPGTLGRSFARVLDRLDTAGITGFVMRIDEASNPPHFGVEIGPVRAGAPTASLTTWWRVADWNHLVGTWEAGGSPSLSFTLNGGGPDGGATRFTTSAPWTASSPVEYFRFGSNNSPNDGVMDDVAVWSRTLSAAEIGAVYTAGMAGKSLGELCKLP
ncbi:MAG: hypothetical protein JST00_37200 [Deltaproteobacteria bacterium]|nr:hypothetical protein [Deltaproteobacteria bacterium]